jgi:hypothetical protein
MRRRIAPILATLVVALLLVLAPAALAAETHPGGDVDRALISLQGDVTLPAGDQADLVLVVGGTATIDGDATTVVAIDGTVVVRDGTVGSVGAVGSDVEVGAGATVTGDVLTLDQDRVTIAAGAAFGGAVRDLAPQLIGLGFVLGPAMFLLFIGFVLVTIVAGVVLAGMAARQVRAAERLISREPGTVLLTGIAGIFAPILLVAALIVTVVGAPLGVAILVTVWPLAAYLGYLVAGIWIGEWLLARVDPGRAQATERPYAAAVVGLVVLQALSIVPPLSAIASLFGYGAVLLLAWRVLRTGGAADTGAVRGVAPAPLAG